MTCISCLPWQMSRGAFSRDLAISHLGLSHLTLWIMNRTEHTLYFSQVILTWHLRHWHIKHMEYSRFWLKMADVESKSIPHELPSSHWLKATGQCVLERYLSATMHVGYSWGRLMYWAWGMLIQCINLPHCASRQRYIEIKRVHLWFKTDFVILYPYFSEDYQSIHFRMVRNYIKIRFPFKRKACQVYRVKYGRGRVW